MNIGLFTDAYYPNISGVVSSIATLRQALEELGHTVYIITNHSGTDIIYEDGILKLPGVELKFLYGFNLSMPFQFPTAGKYITEMNLDIIHVHTEFGIGIYARRVAEKLGIPVVYTYHTMYEDYTHYLNPLDISLVSEVEKEVFRDISRILSNQSDAVIAPSNKTKKKLIEYGTTRPIYIIPTGLDLSEFEYNNLDHERLSSIRKDLGFDEDDHIVTYVGRIGKEKQIEIPIKALSLCEDKTIHLVVVGDGGELPYLQNVAKEYMVDDRVHFVGFVERSIVPYYYAAFDCFVSASITETQGMTYIEALASGLCIFGRRDEVLSDLIEEGVTGFYFDDESELALKMDNFFKKEKEERLSFAQACKEKTYPYNEEQFAKNVLKVYEDVLGITGE